MSDVLEIADTGEKLSAAETNAFIAEYSQEEIPEDYEGLSEKVQEILGDMGSSMLGYAWRIGRMIVAAQEKEGKYGTRIIERLGEDLNKSTTYLSSFKRFYVQHKEATELPKIEFAHARLIGKLTSEEDRTLLEQQAFENNWTVKEVDAAVKEVQKREDEEAGADKKVKNRRAPNAASYFGKMERSLQDFHLDLELMLEQSPDMLLLANDQERTTDEQYEKVVESLEEAADWAAKIVGYLNRMVIPMKDTFTIHSEDSKDGNGEADTEGDG
jgi:hypothetical protein